MSIIDETRFVERQQFFDGQRLFASDLQDLETFHRLMRWLHLRTLHQPGIGKGLAVNGRKGDRQVTIDPGYAIDSDGREIVLTTPQVEAIPPVAGDGNGNSAFYDLTIAYPDDDALEVAETREGICKPRSIVRLREKPVFCWVRLASEGAAGAGDGESAEQKFTVKEPRLHKQIVEGTALVLARIEIRDCTLAQPPLLALRRSARPSRQPYVDCGESPTNVWHEIPPANQIVAKSIEAHVDTSTAGFVTAPSYTARVEGKKIAETGQQGPVLLNPIVSVSVSRPDGFSLTVIPLIVLLKNPLAQALTAEDSAALADEIGVLKFANENWKVVWMGVEN